MDFTLGGNCLHCFRFLWKSELSDQNLFPHSHRAIPSRFWQRADDGKEFFRDIFPKIQYPLIVQENRLWHCEKLIFIVTHSRKITSIGSSFHLRIDKAEIDNQSNIKSLAKSGFYLIRVMSIYIESRLKSWTYLYLQLNECYNPNYCDFMGSFGVHGRKSES